LNSGPIKPRERYVDMKEWTKLLSTNLCPFCGSNLANIPDAAQLNRLRLGCVNCNHFLLPPGPKQREKVKRKLSLGEKERQAEQSGGSLYPPLELHYFCQVCYEKDIERKIKLAKREAKIKGQDFVRYTTTVGVEGMSNIEILNRSVSPEGDNVFPFSCRCGSRYQVNLTMFRSDPKDYQLFGIELGFHSQCVNCRHCFGKRVDPEEMLFRCDFDLQCPHIKEHLDRVRLVDEEELY